MTQDKREGTGALTGNGFSTPLWGFPFLTSHARIRRWMPDCLSRMTSFLLHDTLCHTGERMPSRDVPGGETRR